MEKGQQRVDLRQQMPNVARTVDEFRARWGEAHVNQCIKAGLAGTPDRFYAFEAGHTIGTPFAADPVVAEHVRLSVVLGGWGAVCMPPPREAQYGA